MATVIAYKIYDGTQWVELALKSAIPTNTNQLTNGAGFITSSALSGYATENWVGSNYLGKTAKAADADKLDGHDSSYFQVALPTTTTAGKVLKSTSTAGTVEWGDDNNANYYPSRSYSSGLQISTSSGVANTCALFVPDATTSQKGVLALTGTNLNTMINQLTTGSSTPTDNDYYVSQYVGGGSSTVTYHRRPMSALYAYIKAKTDAVYVASSSLGTAAYVNTGTGSGNIPVLDSNGKLSTSVLPALAITDTFVCDSQTAMLALTAQVGDVCVRTDLNKSYILKTDGASTLSHWQELLTPTDAVQSVNGQTGTVVLTAADVSAVRYDINNQGLTTTQKSNARTNIGAGTGNGNVTGSSLSSNYIVVGNSGSAIKNSGYMPAKSTTTWNDSSEIYIPTMASIAAYVSGATSGKFVRYDIGSQGLSVSQQAQARANIGAGQVDGTGFTADCFIVGFDGTAKVQTTTYKPAPYATQWDGTSDVYIPTMKAIVNNCVDLTTDDQIITGRKIFKGIGEQVTVQLGESTQRMYFKLGITPTGFSIEGHNTVGASNYQNQGTLIFPTFLTQQGDETIATREWVQSQGGGGGSKYLHTVTIESLNVGAYYTFTFCFLADYNTPLEDIEGLYNYLLDETNNLDAYGSGSFCNLTYAGTSTANRVYDANRIVIDNGTLFIEGYAMYSSQLQANIDKAMGFLCYGDQNDYWGWDGRVIDNVTPA